MNFRVYIMLLRQVLKNCLKICPISSIFYWPLRLQRFTPNKHYLPKL